MSDADCRERLAVLETNQHEMKEDFFQHSKREDKYMADTRDILNEIYENQAQMKGFGMGVAFSVSAMVTAVGITITLMVNKFFSG